MGSFKEINIIIYITFLMAWLILKTSDSKLLKIDKRSWKNIDNYYNGYITMKNSDYVKINSVNLLYLIINKVDGYIEKKWK